MLWTGERIVSPGTRPLELTRSAMFDTARTQLAVRCKIVRSNVRGDARALENDKEMVDEQGERRIP